MADQPLLSPTPLLLQPVVLEGGLARGRQEVVPFTAYRTFVLLRVAADGDGECANIPWATSKKPTPPSTHPLTRPRPSLLAPPLSLRPSIGIR